MINIISKLIGGNYLDQPLCITWKCACIYCGYICDSCFDKDFCSKGLNINDIKKCNK